MREEEGLSPAMQLLKLAYEHSGHGAGRSNTRRAMYLNDAWHLAITGLFRFDVDDLQLPGQGRPWARVYDFEVCYAWACGGGRTLPNKSALKALEKLKGRKPYVFGRRRLHVGSMFVWQGERVSVTSFNDEKGHLTACSYKSDEEKQAIYDQEAFQAKEKSVMAGLAGTPERVPMPVDRRYVSTVKRVFKITHQDLRQHNERLLGALPLPEDER